MLEIIEGRIDSNSFSPAKLKYAYRTRIFIRRMCCV